MIRSLALFAVLLCWGSGAQALSLDHHPNAQETATRITGPDSYAAPVAAYDAGEVARLTLEGQVNRRALRIVSEGLTTLQVLAPLRAQIEALGYRIVFECDTAACGGFDFRFAIEVLPGPNMYVNLGRFRHITALKGPKDAPEAAVTVLVSATAASAYVQVIHVETGPVLPNVISPEQDAPRPAADAPAEDSMLARLETRGFVVLTNLEFATGSTDLGAGPFPSLAALAEALKARPGWRVALVGHTDTVGGLAPNIALSRARAASVRSRLIQNFGIAPDRLDAEGTGYLAPLASNATTAGRADNRRVEAVLLTNP